MNTPADKIQENKNQAAANAVQKAGNEATAQLAENVHNIMTPSNLKDTIDNSPQVQQLKAYSAMANSSPQVRQLQAYQEMANDHALQRKELEVNQHAPAPLVSGSHNASRAVVQRVIIPLDAGLNLTLDMGAVEHEVLEDASVDLGDEMRICNAQYMKFEVPYTLTNSSGTERNISIGLIQNAIQDDVTGTYENATGDEVSLDTFGADVPFLDGGESEKPWYDESSVDAYETLNELAVEGTLTLQDRPGIAIPHTIEGPESVSYTSTALSGTRGLGIWLGIKEGGVVIATVPVCTWTINLETGVVTVAAGGGVPLTD